MAKLETVTVLLLLFAISQLYQINGQKTVKRLEDIISKIKPKDCGSNAHFVNTSPNLNCITNCQNYASGPKLCTKELYFGSFCACDDGFIFFNGTDGSCTRPKDCPK